MAGVQLTAGHGVVKTDENGNFLLRDLPAGDLTITLVPVKPLMPGMKVPSGVVHMPAEPIQVQGATIVISNPELAPYLTQLLNGGPKVEAQAGSVAAPLETKESRDVPTKSQKAVSPASGANATDYR
jgi:hypothetical protein